MKLAQILNVLRAVAPEDLAEPWDKVGLHLGDPDSEVDRGLLCIDLAPAVLAEAAAHGAGLVVAYHPPIFQPLERLTTETWKGRLLLDAARRGIALYSPHTALDAVTGGVNDFLADALGPGQRRPIKPAPSGGRGTSREMKLVTFVPEEQVDAVRRALSDAGAGVIGDYTECSFTSPGYGTFRGGDSTHPTVGERGAFERVPELRLEMVLPTSTLISVVEALRQSHPYEEPAFDLVPLASPPEAEKVVQGAGRVVELEEPVSLADLATRLSERLGGQRVEVASPREAKRVRCVGLCPGAGGSLLAEPGAHGIDAFFTGEMRHHDILDATQRGIAILLAGHTQTERPYLETYRQRIIEAGGGKVEWAVSRQDRAPGA